MARRILRFAVAVVPGSTPAAPVSTPLALPPMVVDEVRLRVPPGPSGTVGLALAVADQQIIPFEAGVWIVADNEAIDYPLDNFPDSGAWSLLAYNTGTYPHTLQVSFLLSLRPPPVALPAPLIPAASLGSGA